LPVDISLPSEKNKSGGKKKEREKGKKNKKETKNGEQVEISFHFNPQSDIKAAGKKGRKKRGRESEKQSTFHFSSLLSLTKRESSEGREKKNPFYINPEFSSASRKEKGGGEIISSSTTPPLLRKREERWSSDAQEEEGKEEVRKYAGQQFHFLPLTSLQKDDHCKCDGG